MTRRERDVYEGQINLGRIVRAAAAAAKHDDSDPDLERINNILVGEEFVAALAKMGCMVTRIPSKKAK